MKDSQIEIASLRKQRDGYQRTTIEQRDTIAAQQQQIDALREGLGEAVATIKAWHNMGTKGRVAEQMWELYQQSPEMKRINAALLAVTPQEER